MLSKKIWQQLVAKSFFVTHWQEASYVKMLGKTMALFEIWQQLVAKSIALAISSSQGLEEGLDLGEVSCDPVKDGDDQNGDGERNGAAGFL